MRTLSRNGILCTKRISRTFRALSILLENLFQITFYEISKTSFQWQLINKTGIFCGHDIGENVILIELYILYCLRNGNNCSFGILGHFDHVIDGWKVQQPEVHTDSCRSLTDFGKCFTLNKPNIHSKMTGSINSRKSPEMYSRYILILIYEYSLHLYFMRLNNLNWFILLEHFWTKSGKILKINFSFLLIWNHVSR